MASVSYKGTSARLEEIAATTNAAEFVYDLLRIFGSVTETSINRIKAGTGNMAKDGKTVLAKFGKPLRVVAYRSATPDGLAKELEFLKNDKKVMKQAPRLLIVSDGKKVLAHDPKEVEDYLYTMPGIKDVQVVGIKSEKYGEEVGAFIILKPEAKINEEDVREFCRGQISRYKIPKYVFFVDSYPMTQSGKVKKNLLREEGNKKAEELGITT